jgi:hypothetical protein
MSRPRCSCNCECMHEPTLNGKICTPCFMSEHRREIRVNFTMWNVHEDCLRLRQDMNEFNELAATGITLDGGYQCGLCLKTDDKENLVKIQVGTEYKELTGVRGDLNSRTAIYTVYTVPVIVGEAS